MRVRVKVRARVRARLRARLRLRPRLRLRLRLRVKAGHLGQQALQQVLRFDTQALPVVEEHGVPGIHSG